MMKASLKLYVDKIIETGRQVVLQEAVGAGVTGMA